VGLKKKRRDRRGNEYMEWVHGFCIQCIGFSSLAKGVGSFSTSFLAYYWKGWHWMSLDCSGKFLRSRQELQLRSLDEGKGERGCI
jgi:hypothetical protein